MAIQQKHSRGEQNVRYNDLGLHLGELALVAPKRDTDQTIAFKELAEARARFIDAALTIPELLAMHAAELLSHDTMRSPPSRPVHWYIRRHALSSVDELRALQDRAITELCSFGDLLAATRTTSPHAAARAWINASQTDLPTLRAYAPFAHTTLLGSVRSIMEDSSWSETLSRVKPVPPGRLPTSALAAQKLAGSLQKIIDTLYNDLPSEPLELANCLATIIHHPVMKQCVTNGSDELRNWASAMKALVTTRLLSCIGRLCHPIDGVKETWSSIAVEAAVPTVMDYRARRTALILSNAALLVRPVSKAACERYPADTLIGAAYAGLAQAVDRFDGNVSTTFSTYGMHWINQSISVARTSNEQIVRGSNLYRPLVRQAARELRARLQREPNSADLAEYLKRPSSRITDTLRAMKHPQSLEIPRPYRGNGEHIERPCRPRYREDEENVERSAAHLQHRDLLPDYRTPSAESRTEHNELRAGIDSVLRTLPSREANVLRLLFGLGSGRELTLTQIGERLGVSRERVRQISVKALERIRTSFRQKALKPFIEDAPSREQ